MTTSSTSLPRLWSILSDKSGAENALFMNRLPYLDREVKLGISLPVEGDYTFDLIDLTKMNGIESVVLLDKKTNIKTELLDEPYSFQTSGALQTNDRFSLFIKKSITSIDTPKTGEIYAYTGNNVLTVKNVLPGSKIQVLDLAGRSIAIGLASGDEFSTLLNQKGVYIVNVTGEKTAVLKVLNK
jgi:hypothetical protein